MKIQVSPRMTIAELQQAFGNLFPNLSLSFFTKPQGVYRFSPVKYLITELNMLLERLESKPHSAEVDIYGEMTTGEFENLFEQEFGLHVQVLGLDTNTWTEITGINHLTLREQNASLAGVKDFLRQLLPANDYTDARTEWYLG